jgi:hypothetical protein
MNNTSKILIAAASGVAVGALLGIFFAPAKGTDLRKNIENKGKELVDSMKEKFRKSKEQLNHVKEVAEEKVAQMV